MDSEKKAQLQVHARAIALSINESYKRSAEAIQVLTGISVSQSTQQRLVQRQTFELPKVEQVVEELSVDGGKVRLRNPKGQPSEWRDYNFSTSIKSSGEPNFSDTRHY